MCFWSRYVAVTGDQTCTESIMWVVRYRWDSESGCKQAGIECISWRRCCQEADEGDRTASAAAWAHQFIGVLLQHAGRRRRNVRVCQRGRHSSCGQTLADRHTTNVGLERRSLAGELSLSCARPAADGWPLLWVNHPLQISRLGQLSLSSFWGR